jgi:ABC-type sugar transport system ATPase subunit
VDVAARLEIYRHIEDWLTQGVGVLLITSDLDEMLHLSRRVLVMRRGRVVAEFVGSQISREAVLHASAQEG